MEDIRWKQRFDNFQRAFLRLSEAARMGELNELERNGFIQRFEFTIELAWKTLKDYMELEGFTLKSPKETIRQAYRSGYISDGQVWIDALATRNLLSHDYSEEHFDEAEEKIREILFPAIEELYTFFLKEAEKKQ